MNRLSRNEKFSENTRYERKSSAHSRCCKCCCNHCCRRTSRETRSLSFRFVDDPRIRPSLRCCYFCTGSSMICHDCRPIRSIGTGKTECECAWTQRCLVRPIHRSRWTLDDGADVGADCCWCRFSWRFCPRYSWKIFSAINDAFSLTCRRLATWNFREKKNLWETTRISQTK